MSGRYINADKFAKRVFEVAYPIVHDINSHEKGLTIFGIAQVLDEQATADVRENVHGEWRRDFDGNEFYWYCTHCKTEYYEEDLLMGGNVLPRFCPICGCDMRKGETNG